MKISKLLILPALLLGTIAYAHEFWLEPARFLLKKDEQTRIDLMVGEDYLGEHSNGQRYKIMKLSHYANKTTEDIRDKIYGDSLSSFDVAFPAAGSHLIAFTNTSKFIELEAHKFNDYLRSEGLDNAAQSRVQKGDTLKPGREQYQRCVKTLLQVGDKTDMSYAINTGLRLEIIPARNPYAIKSATAVTFKILFDNAPLEGALVLAWHSDGGKTTHTTMRSDKRGEVKFPISRMGKWMISTVRMIPSEEPQKSDWQSFWGSYTFGYF